jgi:hypothetical protein
MHCLVLRIPKKGAERAWRRRRRRRMGEEGISTRQEEDNLGNSQTKYTGSGSQK